MTEADKIALEGYTRNLAEQVGLSDWRFEFLFEDSEFEDSALWQNDPNVKEMTPQAQSLPIPGMRKAKICYSPSLRECSEDEVTEIICHELLHCHMADLYECGRVGLADQLLQPTYDVWMHGFSLAWEHAIDAISCAWAKELTPFIWPKETRAKN